MRPIKPGDIFRAHMRCTTSSETLRFPPILLFEEGETLVVLSVEFQDLGETHFEGPSADFVMLSTHGPIHWQRTWRDFRDFLTNVSEPA